jgi:hypothetical protein
MYLAEQVVSLAALGLLRNFLPVLKKNYQRFGALEGRINRLNKQRHGCSKIRYVRSIKIVSNTEYLTDCVWVQRYRGLA